MIYQFRASPLMTITLRTQIDGDALMKHTNARKKKTLFFFGNNKNQRLNR